MQTYEDKNTIIYDITKINYTTVDDRLKAVSWLLSG